MVFPVPVRMGVWFLVLLQAFRPVRGDPRSTDQAHIAQNF